MCKAQEAIEKTDPCRVCPIMALEIDEHGCDAIFSEWADKADWEEVEDVIETWAAEHPVVYPTWGEYLVSINALYERWDDHVNDYDIAEYVVKAIRKPIPADTAQKLKLQPKED